MARQREGEFEEDFAAPEEIEAVFSSRITNFTGRAQYGSSKKNLSSSVFVLFCFYLDIGIKPVCLIKIKLLFCQTR